MVEDAPMMLHQTLPPKQILLDVIPDEMVSTVQPYVEYPYEAMDSSAYHCFKDLVCGNVDKASVEGGWAECGFLVNGLSISLLVICTIFKL